MWRYIIKLIKKGIDTEMITWYTKYIVNEAQRSDKLPVLNKRNIIVKLIKYSGMMKMARHNRLWLYWALARVGSNPTTAVHPISREELKSKIKK